MADTKKTLQQMIEGGEIDTNLPHDRAFDVIGKDITAALKVVKESIKYSDDIGWIRAFDVSLKTEAVKNQNVPIVGASGASLRPGRYLALYGYAVEKDNPNPEAAKILDGMECGGILLATDREQIEGDNIEVIRVDVFPWDDDESEPANEIVKDKELYMIKNTVTGAYISIPNFRWGLVVVAISEIDLIKYGADGADDRGEQIASEVIEAIEAETLGNSPLMVRNGKLFTDAMRGKPKKADIWPTGKSVTAEMGRVAISADTEKELLIAIGGSKTLIQLNALATGSGYRYEKDKPCRIETTLDELIEQRPGEDVKNKKTRAKITRELKAISSIAWSFENGKGEFVRIPLAGGMCSVRSGKVSFVFSAEYMGAVLDRAAGRLPLDRLLLATDEKNNPNATSIGFKLSTHTYQNKGKANENTLSVAKLLEYVNGIPTFEEVSKGNRNYTDRIIRPLERDLNHLQEIGFLDWWEYCHVKGEPLTDEEQAARLDHDGNDTPLPYDIAINCNIQWHLSQEHPEQMAETMAARERKRLAAEEARQEHAEKRKRIDRKKETYIAKAAAKKELDEK